MMGPRVRGRVGQATEPPEYVGKWFAEIFVVAFGEGEADPIATIGPFDSEAIAQKELRTAVRLACETIETNLTDKISGQYVDMKTNILRSWDRKGEH